MGAHRQCQTRSLEPLARQFFSDYTNGNNLDFDPFIHQNSSILTHPGRSKLLLTHSGKSSADLVQNVAMFYYLCEYCDVIRTTKVHVVTFSTVLPALHSDKINYIV